MNRSRRRFIRNSTLATAGIAFSKFSFAYNDADHTYTNIAELSELIRLKKVSPVAIVQACLKRIELFNPSLNAFITVTAETALTEAAIAEKEIKQGKWRGPLHGIPISYKDNIDTAGIKTTAASAVFKSRIPQDDAAVVKKLKAAGVICIGKTNMHEFALGTTSLISFFGAVHNPWNKDIIAGGSSGGSAAAVAAGMCYASIGTDTGGSCRLPPACCGITGFKATYGLVSIEGVIPVSKSYDHVCPISRTAEDAGILLNAMADNDNSSVYINQAVNLKQFRIGIPKSYKASAEVENVFQKAIAVFTAMGCTTVAVDLPKETAGPEIFKAEIEAFHRPLIQQFKELYDPVTLADINSERKEINATDYINEKNKMENDRATVSEIVFKNCDVLMLPTTAAVTPAIAVAKEDGPFTLSPENTEPFSSFGLPAMTVPCGFSSSNIPLGLQIVGARWGEAMVLHVAGRYQKATNWHLKHPAMI